MARVAITMLAVAVPLAAAAEPARAPKTYTIVIDRMAFGQVPTQLRVGDTILWVNRDLFRHTATARDRSFDIDLPPSKSATMTLKRAGTIAFFCTFHPGMTGKLPVAR